MVDCKLCTHLLEQQRLLLNLPNKDANGLPTSILESYYDSTEAHKTFEKIA